MPTTLRASTYSRRVRSRLRKRQWRLALRRVLTRWTTRHFKTQLDKTFAWKLITVATGCISRQQRLLESLWQVFDQSVVHHLCSRWPSISHRKSSQKFGPRVSAARKSRRWWTTSSRICRTNWSRVRRKRISLPWTKTEILKILKNGVVKRQYRS